MDHVQGLIGIVTVLCVVLFITCVMCYTFKLRIDSLESTMHGTTYWPEKGIRCISIDTASKCDVLNKSVVNLYSVILPQLTKDHKEDIDFYARVKLSKHTIRGWDIRYRQGEIMVFFDNEEYTPLPMHLELSTLLERVAELKDLKAKLCCKKA